METRSKNVDRQSVEDTELYPHSMLVDASLYLMKVIDEKDGTSWNELKKKCCIFPWNKNNKNEKGWANPSHHFSLTGLPQEYIEEFSAELDLSSPAANVKTKFKSQRKSVPAATDTLVEDDDVEAMTDNNVPNTESIESSLMHTIAPEPCCSNEEDIRAEESENTVSNGHELDDTSLDGMENPEPEREVIETEEVEAETSPEPCVDAEEGIRAKENDIAATNVEESNDTSEGIKQGLKRKHDSREIEVTDSGDIVVNLVRSDNNMVNGKGKLVKQSVKKLRHETYVYESNKETGNNDVIEIGNTDMQILRHMESSDETVEVENGDTACSCEEILDDLDKGVSSGIVMSTRQGDTYRFKCDFCPAVASHEERMLKHLEEAMHYSASLVSIDANGIPENTVWQCILTHNPASFKTVIAVCPYKKCSEIFRHMYTCASHYNIFHNSEEGPVYALADVIKEERIIGSDIFERCKVCSAKFGKKHIISHMKKKNHLPYTEDEKVRTIFLCLLCEQASPNFFKILSHVQMKKQNKGLEAEIRVFHISRKRVTKTVLPYKMTPEIDLAIINSEINNLKELKRTANGKCSKRRIHAKLQEMKRLKEDPKGIADHHLYFQSDFKKKGKIDKTEKKEKDYANFIESL